MERAFPDGAADERAVLTGFLDWQRATVRRKVDGLPNNLADRALLDTSPLMTVAGVVSHLRQTEHDWFAGSFPSLADEPFVRAPDAGWPTAGRAIADLLSDYEPTPSRRQPATSATWTSCVSNSTALADTEAAGILYAWSTCPESLGHPWPG